VQRYGNAIEYISHPSLEVQFAAVRQNGYAIRYIADPSLEVQLAAVQENGYAIEYISHPSLEVQFAAVQEDGRAIEYIKDPSPEVQLAAVQQNNESISYIFKPDITVKIYIYNEIKKFYNMNAIKAIVCFIDFTYFTDTEKYKIINILIENNLIDSIKYLFLYGNIEYETLPDDTKLAIELL